MLRAGGAIVPAALWAWFLYRNVLSLLMRRRAIVLPSSTAGWLLALPGVAAWVAWPGPPLAVLAVTQMLEGLVVLGSSIWFVFGLDPSRVLERTRFVLRGMGCEYEDPDERTIAVQGKAPMRFRLLSSPAPRVCLLRVQTARGIKKAALLRRNLVKFLAASPRKGEGQ